MGLRKIEATLTPWGALFPPAYLSSWIPYRV
jgi:hypothetical protein